MDEHYRQVLVNVRCEVSLIRDSPFSAVREAAIRMLTVIDTELAAAVQVEPGTPTTDLAQVPSSLLLREISRRMQQIRRVRKLCFRCKHNPARARGLCVRCYKKAYRRGEIRRG